jgi:formylglycine-generating enzyme required for sulfatase activity
VKRLLLAWLALLSVALVLPLAGADKPKGKKGPARTITNSVGMRLVLIPAGEFLMGSPKDEKGRASDEGPRHKVKLTRSFYLGVYAVTQGEYQKITGTNPSWYCATGGGKHKVKDLDTHRFPVERVSWVDAVKCCEKLSELEAEKKAGRKYRLPSEAEWEYACRAGTTTPFHFGKSMSSRQANFDGDTPYGGAAKGAYLRRPAKVGSYRPNAWGLYDMHGNVWQWCQDRFAKDYYRGSPKEDPRGPKKGDRRVLRGGSWHGPASDCRAAFRNWNISGILSDDIGFRVVCAVPKTP